MFTFHCMNTMRKPTFNLIFALLSILFIYSHIWWNHTRCLGDMEYCILNRIWFSRGYEGFPSKRIISNQHGWFFSLLFMYIYWTVYDSLMQTVSQCRSTLCLCLFVSLEQYITTLCRYSFLLFRCLSFRISISFAQEKRSEICFFRSTNFSCLSFDPFA